MAWHGMVCHTLTYTQIQYTDSFANIQVSNLLLQDSPYIKSFWDLLLNFDKAPESVFFYVFRRSLHAVSGSEEAVSVLRDG